MPASVTRSVSWPSGPRSRSQQAGGEQLDLDHVLARPAGRAVDLAQAPPVDDAEGDQATTRGRSERPSGMEARNSEPRPTLPRFNESGGSRR